DVTTASEVTRTVSWASSHWMEEAGNGLTRLVKRLYDSEAGKGCLGWQIAAGEEGEWRAPHAERLPDIGPRMTACFRAFALSKYRRNGGLLRKAWFDTRIKP